MGLKKLIISLLAVIILSITMVITTIKVYELENDIKGEQISD